MTQATHMRRIADWSTLSSAMKSDSELRVVLILRPGTDLEVACSLRLNEEAVNDHFPQAELAPARQTPSGHPLQER